MEISRQEIEQLCHRFARAYNADSPLRSLRDVGAYVMCGTGYTAETAYPKPLYDQLSRRFKIWLQRVVDAYDNGLLELVVREFSDMPSPDGYDPGEEEPPPARRIKLDRLQLNEDEITARIKDNARTIARLVMDILEHNQDIAK